MKCDAMSILKLNPNEFIGDFDLLAIASFHGDTANPALSRRSEPAPLRCCLN